METTDKLVLVDGHNVIHRTYHATFKAAMTTPEGVPSGALLGAIRIVQQLVRTLNPTHMLWCFDNGKSDFRTALDAEYKGHRKTAQIKSPANPARDLPPQVEGLMEALGYMGIRHYDERGVEADDLIAQATFRWGGAGSDVETVIFSGDHDLLQLVAPNVTVIRPGASRTTPGGVGLKSAAIISPLGELYGVEEVREKYGVYPHQLPEVWALTGDPSDNIIGLRNVGPKTAAKWINKHGDLANVLTQEPKCFEWRSDVVRNFRMICLNGRQGTIPFDLRGCAIGKPDVAALDDFCARWKFTSLEGAFV